MERDIMLVINVTGRKGDQLDLLVENMGRVNFGPKINDYKVQRSLYLEYNHSNLNKGHKVEDFD